MYTLTNALYEISDDRARLDLDVIHEFLTRSYWAEGIKKERIARAIEHSYPFGLYTGDRQIGFGRVLSDLSAIAYLMDVFVQKDYRGKGLGKWLVEAILAYPEFEPVRRWVLATEDAHSLYAKYGFTPYEPMDSMMMRLDPDKYKRE
ncbi:GNAT family N-acetyltransferase [bacterium]|nr:GNAT family N-acetyltransferase [bacterium]